MPEANRRKTADTNRAAAAAFTVRVWPVIHPLYDTGASTTAIAAHLTKRGFPTPAGGRWCAAGVWRVIERAHEIGLSPRPARTCAEAQQLRRDAERAARAPLGSFPDPRAGGVLPAARSGQCSASVKAKREG
ncbi:hypothetical protein FH063_005962 [Azospirillum argentinense]|uniref:Recombinase domain-containing protein n=1 Tax=Azospirillum argentinense TaxID=2970906 RepID=A0A5B0KS55_9PROT|nr:hypothetical protein FH063_005962 [Azospirillum argentinense]